MSSLGVALRHEHVLAFTLAAIEADLDDLLLPWMIDLSSRSDLSRLRCCYGNPDSHESV